MKNLLKKLKSKNNNQLKEDNSISEKDKSQSNHETPDFSSLDLIINSKILLNSFPELSKDQLTKNLILLLIRFKQLNNEESKENESEEIKNNLIKKIFNILKTHKTFCVYFYNNHVDDSIIFKLIPYLNYEYYEKGKYICKEGDSATEIYFVLKGEISIRKKAINFGTLKEEEVENNKISDNSNIGAWDIIYERKRKLSYYTLTNCHIITLKKDIFKMYLIDKFNKTESEKQLFLTNFFNTYSNFPQNKIERIILNNLNTLLFKKGEIICKEGDDNKYLYLVFIGEVNVLKDLRKNEFSVLKNYHNSVQLLQLKAKNIDYFELIKNINQANNNKNQITKMHSIKSQSHMKNFLKKENENDMINDDNDVKNSEIICTLSKGFVGGLEICSGMTKSNYSLISNINYTTVFQIDLEKFNEGVNTFLIKLIPLFVDYEKQIHLNINKIKYIDNNVVPLNCQKFNDERITIESISNNIEENESIFHRKIKKINDNLEINEGGFIKFNAFNLKLSKEKTKLREKLQKSKRIETQIDNFMKIYDAKNTHLNYSKVKLRNSFISKNNIHNDIDKKKLNDFYTSRNRNKSKNENYTKKIIELFERLINKNYLVKQYSDEERKFLLEKNKERIKNLKEIKLNNFNKNKFINEVIIFQDSNTNTIASPGEKLFKKKFLKTGYNFTIESDKINDNKKIYKIINSNYIKKLFKNNSVNKGNKTKINNKGLKLNDKKMRMIYYNTGSYDMPLVTHLKKKKSFK